MINYAYRKPNDYILNTFCWRIHRPVIMIRRDNEMAGVHVTTNMCNKERGERAPI